MVPGQVGHRDAPVDDQALDLVEHRQVGGVGRVPAVGAARGDDVDGRLLGLHHVDLHVRRVGPQQHRVAAASPMSTQRVSHIDRAGWLSGMLRASKLYQSVSISGPSATRVAHAHEDVLEGLPGLGDDVEVADRSAGRRPRSGRGARPRSGRPARPGARPPPGPRRRPGWPGWWRCSASPASLRVASSSPPSCLRRPTSSERLPRTSWPIARSSSTRGRRRRCGPGRRPGCGPSSSFMGPPPSPFRAADASQNHQATVALAAGLVEQDGGRHGHVQRLDAAVQRQGHLGVEQLVLGQARRPRPPAPGPRGRTGRPRRGSSPPATAPTVVEAEARQVVDRWPRAGRRGPRRWPARTLGLVGSTEPGRQQDAGGAGGRRRADDGAGVARVADPGQDDDRQAGLLGPGHDLGGGGHEHGGHGHDGLGRAGGQGALELLALDVGDRGPGRPGPVDQLDLGPADDEDLVEVRAVVEGRADGARALDDEGPFFSPGAGVPRRGDGPRWTLALTRSEAAACSSATATRAVKAAGSVTARSARILRSTSTSAAFRPAMNRL